MVATKVDAMVTEDMVKKIQAATKEAQKAVQRRDALVRKARDKGATWTQIGYALGVTAQAAQKKYGNTQERTQAYLDNLARRAEKRASRKASEG